MLLFSLVGVVSRKEVVDCWRFVVSLSGWIVGLLTTSWIAEAAVLHL